MVKIGLSSQQLSPFNLNVYINILNILSFRGIINEDILVVLGQNNFMRMDPGEVAFQVFDSAHWTREHGNLNTFSC